MIYNTSQTISVVFLYLPFCKEISQKTIESFLEIEVLSQDVEVPHLATHLDKDLDNSRRGSVYNLHCTKKVIQTINSSYLVNKFRIYMYSVYFLVRKKLQNYQLLLFGRLNINCCSR